ncbi:hypothetical protein RUM44_005891 [Polyplax serrata]|uniref:Uncharacterized protein n=1 Tax=Polyplax serrata TaxID=468196 RepID=A0ABR1AYZ4_POLSC
MSSEWIPLGAKLSRLAPLALSWRKGDKKPKRCPPSQRTVKNRQGLLGVTTDRGDNQGREDFEPTENAVDPTWSTLDITESTEFESLESENRRLRESKVSLGRAEDERGV